MPAHEPHYDWPQPFLLDILGKTVHAGYIYVENITEVAAKSLKMRLLRLRRRKDSGAIFTIPPEYHLVNFGQWTFTHCEPNQPPLGRFLCIYNRLPEGMDLPTLRVPDTAEIHHLEQFSQPTPVITPEDLKVNKQDIARFIDDLINKQ